jgi:hypothetical protein
MKEDCGLRVQGTLSSKVQTPVLERRQREREREKKFLSFQNS